MKKNNGSRKRRKMETKVVNVWQVDDLFTLLCCFSNTMGTLLMSSSVRTSTTYIAGGWVAKHHVCVPREGALCWYFTFNTLKGNGEFRNVFQPRLVTCCNLHRLNHWQMLLGDCWKYAFSICQRWNLQTLGGPFWSSLERNVIFQISPNPLY